MKIRIPIELMNGRGDNDANADGHGTDQYRQSHIVLLNYFLPQVIWGQLVHDQESDHEYHYADKCKDQRAHYVGKGKYTHLIYLQCNDDIRCRPRDRSQDCLEWSAEHFLLGPRCPGSSRDSLRYRSRLAPASHTPNRFSETLIVLPLQNRCRR